MLPVGSLISMMHKATKMELIIFTRSFFMHLEIHFWFRIQVKMFPYSITNGFERVKSSSHHCTIMSLQRLEENYHKVCHNYLSYSAISSFVSGKGSRYQDKRLLIEGPL